MAKKHDPTIETIDDDSGSDVAPIEGLNLPPGEVRTLAQDHVGPSPRNAASPTGVSKAKITLADYQVNVRSKKRGLITGIVKATAGPTHAIREFMLAHGLQPNQCASYNAFKVENTERPAGEEGYHSDQIDGHRPSREMQPV